MIRCLLISPHAEEYAQELSRYSELPVSLTLCADEQAAVQAQGRHRIAFGDPDIVAAVLTQRSDIEWVQSTWAGVRQLLDVGRQDYVLTGVKDVFGPQIAEYVFGMLLAHELRLTRRREAQQQRRWYAAPTGTLTNKTLGVMGTGSIGAYLAKAASVFGMRTVGFSRSGNAHPDFARVSSQDQLHEFLRDCDYLVSVLPDLDGTTNLLDAAAFAVLPRHAVVVNVGRGNVVDEAALVDALEAGSIAAAILDVFDEEPLSADSPMWATRNLTLTAHVAGGSSAELIVPIFVENLQRFLREEPLRYTVDFDVGY